VCVEVGLREGVAADMFRMLGADDLDAAFCLLSRRAAITSPHKQPGLLTTAPHRLWPTGGYRAGRPGASTGK
jgi:hypothetical protein